MIVLSKFNKTSTWTALAQMSLPFPLSETTCLPVHSRLWMDQLLLAHCAAHRWLSFNELSGVSQRRTYHRRNSRCHTSHKA